MISMISLITAFALCCNLGRAILIYQRGSRANLESVPNFEPVLPISTVKRKTGLRLVRFAMSKIKNCLHQ